MAFLSVAHLTKQYDGIEAVNDFSFEVEAGEIYALVGPDGAGKTTIMRSLASLITIDTGDITINDLNAKTQFKLVKEYLGYMPQTFSLYPDLSVSENLTFYGGIHGISGKTFQERSESLYSFSHLKPFANRRAQALSGGMKQKLALMCALIHNPKLLLLDEPTTGVDPLSRRQFWEMLLALKKEGVTIVVSTPYMDEVARADRACFIFNGKKLAEDTPALLPRLFKGQLFFLDLTPTAELVSYINTHAPLQANRFGAGMHLYLPESEDLNNYYDRLQKIGIDSHSIHPIKPGLEDCFIQLMD